jgi:DNA-directed RNA polymerase specialized sigma24 family protein
MIVILLYGEGYNAAEIAGLTGLSRTNVKVRAFRIRRRLRMLDAGGVG